MKELDERRPDKMASYRQIYYHLVFGTFNHKPTLPDEYCEELYKYIWGIIKNKQCKLFRINGSKEHLHLLTDLHPTVNLADFVKDIKVSSSIWLKHTGNFPYFEGWAEGYGAFTVSHFEKDKIIEYIKRQKEHHYKESFIEEYKRLLKDFGIEYDEKYLH